MYLALMVVPNSVQAQDNVPVSLGPRIPERVLPLDTQSQGLRSQDQLGVKCLWFQPTGSNRFSVGLRIRTMKLQKFHGIG